MQQQNAILHRFPKAAWIETLGNRPYKNSPVSLKAYFVDLSVDIGKNFICALKIWPKISLDNNWSKLEIGALVVKSVWRRVLE